MDMKYIVVEARAKTTDMEVELPIIFPHFIVHRDMMLLLRRHRSPLLGPLINVVGAGFVRSRADGTLEAYGMSESLDVHSRPQDTALINNQNRSWNSVRKILWTE